MRNFLNASLALSSQLFSTAEEKLSFTPRDFSSAKRSSFLKRPKFNLPTSAKLLLPIIGIILFIGIILVFRNTQGTTSNSSKPVAPVSLSKQVINKEFSFPIKDNGGKEISKVKLLVENVSIQDDILVKGQRARAVQGRTFLILNLKITNTYKQGIQIYSRDYILLVINGNKKELIAADIHNDPVEIQAISTKTTRIGFPINEIDRNLEILVGEINGRKETIKLTVNQ